MKIVSRPYPSMHPSPSLLALHTHSPPLSNSPAGLDDYLGCLDLNEQRNHHGVLSKCRFASGGGAEILHLEMQLILSPPLELQGDKIGAAGTNTET